MDVANAIQLAIAAVETAVKVAPIIAQGIGDLKVYAVALFEKFSGNEITPKQRQELEDKIDMMHLEFQAPIPPVNER